MSYRSKSGENKLELFWFGFKVFQAPLPHNQVQCPSLRSHMSLLSITGPATSPNIGGKVGFAFWVNNIKGYCTQPIFHSFIRGMAVMAQISIIMCKHMGNLLNTPTVLCGKLIGFHPIFPRMRIKSIPCFYYNTVILLVSISFFLKTSWANLSSLDVVFNIHSFPKPFLRCPKPTLFTNSFHTIIIPQLSIGVIKYER